MMIKVDPSNAKGLEWYQYGIRFALGGLVTLAAGILADKFGPSFGGLFLAFPAILPASATLIEQTERSKKRKKGMRGEERGRAAAVLDLYGAGLGSLALMLFAVFVWLSISRYVPWIVLLIATAIWSGGACLGWAASRWWRHR
jgi:hypothetical protein